MFVLIELRSLAIALHVNKRAKSIFCFSPSEKDEYVKSSLYLDLIFSLKFSSNSNETKKSIADRYLLINLLMIGTYCLIILALIPLSFNITPAADSMFLSSTNSLYSTAMLSSSLLYSEIFSSLSTVLTSFIFSISSLSCITLVLIELIEV